MDVTVKDGLSCLLSDRLLVYQYMWGNFVSTVEPDLSIFEPSELKLLAEAKEYFKDFDATQIREFFHSEQGYDFFPKVATLRYQTTWLLPRESFPKRVALM